MAEGGTPAPMVAVEPIIIDDDEELPLEAEEEPSGVTNKCQAAHHRRLIAEALQEFKMQCKTGEVKDMLRQLLEDMKEVITRVYPSMVEADVKAVLRSIPDPTCLAMRPQTMVVEGCLEELIPDEDIPEGLQVVMDISNVKLLTFEQKDMIVSLFNDLAVAHDQLG